MINSKLNLTSDLRLLESTLSKVTLIVDYLNDNDPDEDMFDFDDKLNCFEETADMVQTRIEGSIDAIKQFNNNQTVAYSDIDVCSISSLDDEYDVYDSWGVEESDIIGAEALKLIIKDILSISNEFISSYEKKINKLFPDNNIAF